MSKTKVNLIDLDEVTTEDVAHDVPVAFDEEGKAVAGFKINDANSKRFRDTKRAIDVAAVKKAGSRRKSIDGKTDEGAAQLLDIADAQKKALVKGCVVSIYGFSLGGKPAEASDEVLEKILTKYPSLIDKLAAKIDEGAGFLTT